MVATAVGFGWAASGGLLSGLCEAARPFLSRHRSARGRDFSGPRHTTVFDRQDDGLESRAETVEWWKKTAQFEQRWEEDKVSSPSVVDRRELTLFSWPGSRPAWHLRFPGLLAAPSAHSAHSAQDRRASQGSWVGVPGFRPHREWYNHPICLRFAGLEVIAHVVMCVPYLL